MQKLKETGNSQNAVHIYKYKKNLSGQECWGQKRLYVWGKEDVLWP